MPEPLKGREYWLRANGQIVTIDGEKYKVKVRSWKAIYPYEQYVIDVSIDLIDKSKPFYRQIKSQLGDDWMTDVLASEGDIYASVYEEIFGAESQ